MPLLPVRGSAGELAVGVPNPGAGSGGRRGEDGAQAAPHSARGRYFPAFAIGVTEPQVDIAGPK